MTGGIHYVFKADCKKGITRLYLYESYYEPSNIKGRAGKFKQRCIESLGSLEELKKLYDDPVAHFKLIAAQRSLEQKEASQTSISINMKEKLTIHDDDIKNIGYGILKEIYLQLELDRFWKLKTKMRNIQFDVDKIFHLLVFSRILFPTSKKCTFEHRDIFFEPVDGFSLDVVYRCLTIIDLILS